jgi:alpha-glucoside transport system substrate-binding protein
MKGRALRWLVVVLAIAAMVLVACEDEEEAAPAEGETPTGEIGSVNVLGIWGAEELTSFEAMVAPWEDDTGGSVDFTGTRNITADLTLRVEGGNPPDVAIPAEIGLFQEFARDGKLTPLSECPGLEDKIKAEYPEGFIDLGTVDGVLYGFFMKADSKGTIWYNPNEFADMGWEPLTADSSFDDLVSLSDAILAEGMAPWSMGMESAEASGWPGTDWIQQILLNEYGADVYDGLIDGSIAFTDDQVKGAWEMFGQIALGEGYVVQGGADGINATNFQDSSYPPFESPPTAAMLYLGGFAAGFIQDQFPDAVAGEDFDFFPFPGGAVTGGANIVYAFNSDSATCSLLEHLASADGQQIWVDQGGFTSVNKEVSLDAYPDAVARALAEQLTEATLFRFDLDDAIGGALQQAYFVGVTEYLANPDDLDDILAGIEASRGEEVEEEGE